MSIVACTWQIQVLPFGTLGVFSQGFLIHGWLVEPALQKNLWIWRGDCALKPYDEFLLG